MARNLRVEYPDAIHHIMNRGGRREPIFVDEADRQRFVETLGGTRWGQSRLRLLVDTPVASPRVQTTIASRRSPQFIRGRPLPNNERPSTKFSLCRPNQPG